MLMPPLLHIDAMLIVDILELLRCLFAIAAMLPYMMPAIV